MSTLTRHRCLHHPAREAVARCPECTQFYCRECVTEYDDRVLCAGCMAALAAAQSTKTRAPGRATLALSAALGLLAAWLIFYSLGRVFLAWPDELHSRSLWPSTEESSP